MSHLVHVLFIPILPTIKIQLDGSDIFLYFTYSSRYDRSRLLKSTGIVFNLMSSVNCKMHIYSYVMRTFKESMFSYFMELFLAHSYFTEMVSPANLKNNTI